MVKYKETELILDHHFDRESCKHYLNDFTSVLHCHHYTTLLSQLAEDCELLDGFKLLSECAEDCFYEVLSSYFKKHDITKVNDKIKLSEDYFSSTGLGKMKVSYAGIETGKVIFEHSHLDQGWIAKWGKRSKPVNYLGCGYISGMFSAVFNLPVRTFLATEVQSIVMGDDVSVFYITKK